MQRTARRDRTSQIRRRRGMQGQAGQWERGQLGGYFSHNSTPDDSTRGLGRMTLFVLPCDSPQPDARTTVQGGAGVGCQIGHAGATADPMQRAGGCSRGGGGDGPGQRQRACLCLRSDCSSPLRPPPLSALLPALLSPPPPPSVPPSGPSLRFGLPGSVFILPVAARSHALPRWR